MSERKEAEERTTGGEEWKKGRDKEEEEEEEEASSNSPVGDFSSVERIYAATYPGWLLNVRSVFSSGLLSLSLFLHGVCTTMAVRSNVYIHTRGPPFPYTARRDRDAKETRAAFKLAATKRINSPGSLDLLIRAAVAFLRGLDRWGPETPRPSCFLAIASAAGRLAPSRRVCTPAVQLASTIVVRAYPASSPPILFHGFSRGVVGAQ